jgi:hypothetical protein
VSGDIELMRHRLTLVGELAPYRRARGGGSDLWAGLKR